MSETVLKEQHGGVLLVTLNRPEKKNALTRSMYAAMADAIGRADDDSGIRAVFIHGTQDCFTAGNDLKDFQAFRQDGDNKDVSNFLSAISQAQKPLVAAVGGVAVGVGGGDGSVSVEMVAGCLEERTWCLWQ